MNALEPKRTPAVVAAEAMLPPELHSVFEQLLGEYQFASFKHHGQPFASPKVIAELILMGWRSPPLSEPEPSAPQAVLDRQELKRSDR